MKRVVKKILKQILFSSVFFVSTIGYSQYRPNKLSVNPIQLIGYNRLNIEYERAFKEGNYGVGFYMGRTGFASRTVHGQNSFLSEQSACFKFYTNRFDKSSFWYGGSLSVASGNIVSANLQDSAVNIGALGLLAGTGYQLVVKSFYFNTYINLGYSVTNNLFGTARYVGNISKPTEFLLTYGFKIGMCF